ncbi:MAG: protoporphyrinogen oxidase [Thermodesulfovibrionales bacterium]
MDRITIVGGGISGLSLAFFLKRARPQIEVTVLEAEDRPGGKIWSDRRDGFLCESGVNGFLDNRPKTLELASLLSLNPLRSNDNARKRFVFSGGKLRLIPESPIAFLTSDLLSLKGRISLLCEPFQPKGSKDDESLAEFAIRRLGREAYEKLIDPMASGIYAGDPEKLSLKSCFPRIYKLEREYGSLIKGMIKLQKKAKREGKASIGPGPGGNLTSFRSGMGTLIDALKDELDESLKSKSKVVSILKGNRVYNVITEDGKGIESDVVVIATPAHEASAITATLDRGLSELLSKIPYPSLSVICLGYRKDKIDHDLNGFGFLIPHIEGRRILGSLWDSSIFPERSPEGYVLIRSMVGGMRASELALIEKDQLIKLVQEELRDIMGIKEDPDFVSVYVHEKAIPQYTQGHSERLQLIEELLLKYKGLYITGNAYRGIGVNDCIENSYKLTEEILKA